MNVIYGGCKKDKKSREVIITTHGESLKVRRIFRTFTMTDAFKKKYPKASDVDHTRHRSQLLKMVEAVDFDKVLPPNVIHSATIILDGQRYFYSKVSGQWWDLPMIKYWNTRVGDVFDYDRNRTLTAKLEHDNFRNCIVMALNQTKVDKPLPPCSVRVYRNNEEVFYKDFSFTSFNRQFLIAGGIDHLSQVFRVVSLDDIQPTDIFCVKLNDAHQFYNLFQGNKLTTMIPKSLMFGLSEYEALIGEPYRFRDNLLG